MTLLCSRCGRSIRSSAVRAELLQFQTNGYAALGPVCARRLGFITQGPAQGRRIFTLRRSDARQMEIPA